MLSAPVVHAGDDTAPGDGFLSVRPRPRLRCAAGREREFRAAQLLEVIAYRSAR